MNTLMENQLAIGMRIAVLAMFAGMISAIYGDIRRRRAAEAEAEAEAELERQDAESVRAEYEAELEARYQAEIEHSEQYREWQAGGPAPSGWLSQF